MNCSYSYTSYTYLVIDDGTGWRTTFLFVCLLVS